MSAGNLDITIEPGADLEEIFDYDLADSDGTELDFSSGWTAEAQVRRKAASEEVLLELDIDLDTAGVVVVSAPASATEEVERSGEWDLELTKTSSGRIIRLLEGRAKLSPQVTRVGS